MKKSNRKPVTKKGATKKVAPFAKRTKAEIQEQARKRREFEEREKTEKRAVLINEYNNLTRREVTNLVRKAVRGDVTSRSKMMQYSWAISTETNKRLHALEDADKAYGGTYNRLKYFLDIEHESEYAKTPVELRLDWYDMRLQNDQAMHFLTKAVSTVEGQIDREKHRLAKLHELGIIPENYSYRESEEFLRFLGNEEVSAVIDEYGTSDPPVEMMWDAYQGNGNPNIHGKRALDIMSKAFTEHKAGIINPATGRALTFDEAMERVGIKVEDYHSGRPTS